jgi:predicted NUDIX family phosphoesterase/dephospho-CoA kinase
MSGRFIRAAFEVLHKEGKPLTAAQIVEHARASGVLMTGGQTPGNTMRARLSDDIRALGGESQFQRVGPNRFGLRDWDFGEYHGRPFQKGIPTEVTVCIRGTIQEDLGLGGVGYFSLPVGLMSHLRDQRHLHYLPRATAETTSKYKQLIAYVWLETRDGHVLSYTRGKYSSAHRTLMLGKRSVGFGGHVQQIDSQGLFGANDAGLEQAALREIGEELKGLLPTQLRPVGVIWDDSSYEGQRHIGMVLRGELPDAVQIEKRKVELSINQLQLLSKEELWASYHSMEFWSQLLVRQFAPEQRPTIVSTIVPAKRPARVSHIALVGEIASGKTSIAGALADTGKYQVVSVSSLLTKLLGFGQFSEQRRLEFQAVALQFIKSPDGPARLADVIAAEMSRLSTKKAVVDGLRQISTLTALRALMPELTVIYVDCPRDVAFRNYQTRLPGASILQFAAVREHEVESELPLFRYEADAILNNADETAKTLKVLQEWIGV